MPYLSQAIIYLIMSLKAKRSIVSHTPQSIWINPKNLDIQRLPYNDWLNPHKIFTLTFLITRPPIRNKIFHIVSFYYVDPRWQLTTPIEIELNKILTQNNIDAPYNLITPPEAIYYINPDKKDINYIKWQFVKQNDINIQYLIVERIMTNSPFFIPYSDIKIYPVGINPPITSPSYKFDAYINIDPTSKKYIHKGHNIYLEAMQQQWIFNPFIDFLS